MKMNESGLSSRRFVKATKAVAAIAAAGSLFAGSPSTEAQGVVETLTFSGGVNQLYGTGNGSQIGDEVSGILALDFVTSDLFAGNGSTTVASCYYSAGSTATITDNGVTTLYQGIELDLLIDSVDYTSANHPANVYALFWGNGNTLTVATPTSSASNSSLSSFQAMSSSGLSGALPYSGDAFFTVNTDPRGGDYGQGNVSTLQFAATPEPSTFALGAAGAATLAAMKLRKRMQVKPQANIGMK